MNEGQRSGHMKQLLLLRHAKAAPAEEALADIGRVLTERGEQDARRMGERLREHFERPDLILTSPATRTRQTAGWVARALAYPEPEIAIVERLYLAGLEEILDVIRGQAHTVARLLVVGHNPGLTELAQRLAPTFPLDDLPTAGAVGLDVEALGWAELSAESARLAYCDYPKNPSAPTSDLL